MDVKYSTNDKFIISSNYKKIKIWNSSNGELINTLKQDFIITCISANGKYIIAGCYNGNIYKYDAKTNELIETKHLHDNAITCIASSHEPKFKQAIQLKKLT